MCAWWCCTRANRAARPRARRPTPRCGRPGAGRRRALRAATPVIACRWLGRGGRTPAGSPDRPCRRRAPTARRSGRAPTQKVFFRSPPTASAGRTGDGQRHRHAARSRASGAPAARPPAATRTTESSHGTWIGRSCRSHASARPARRSTGLVVVGDDRLAGEVAARHHQHPRAGRIAGQAEQQVVHRRVGEHHAEVGTVGRDRVGQPQRRFARAGQQHDRSARSSSSSARSAASSVGERARRSRGRRTITANGLSPRSLRLRRWRPRPRRSRRRPGGSRRGP